MPAPLIIITGPSASGKTTLAEALRERHPSLRRVVTCTTRPMRADEKQDQDYHFLSREQFEKELKEGRFIEHAQIYEHLYGSRTEDVVQARLQTNPLLMVLDVQGTKTVKSLFPDATVLYLDVPRDQMERRLRDRHADPADREARLQRYDREQSARKQADFVIPNPDGSWEETLQTVEKNLKEVLTEPKS